MPMGSKRIQKQLSITAKTPTAQMTENILTLKSFRSIYLPIRPYVSDDDVRYIVNNIKSSII